MPKAIRFFPDFDRDWPLWGGPGELMTPADYGLSDELTAEISEWNDLWQREYSLTKLGQWSDPQIGLKWSRWGRSLATRMQAEVGDDYRVLFYESP
jgi:hypothetical protein